MYDIGVYIYMHTHLHIHTYTHIYILYIFIFSIFHCIYVYVVFRTEGDEMDTGTTLRFILHEICIKLEFALLFNINYNPYITPTGE